MIERSGFIRACEEAKRIVDSWPEWKQGVLEASSQSTVSVPRTPIGRTQPMTPTTPTKRVVKTPGQIDYELWWTAIGNTGSVEDGWSVMSSSLRDGWEKHAASLPTPIEPLTEDVPEPKTDGELLQQAYVGTCGWDGYAAEFLRLRAERDGDVAKSEPLEVTASMIEDWESDYILMEPKTERRESYLARQVNANRGVRQVPQVTEEIWRKADKAWCEYDGTVSESDVVAVGILNAELAKAGKLCR